MANLSLEQRRQKYKKAFSVFDDELNVKFNPEEWKSDISQSKTSPSEPLVTKETETSDKVRTNLGQHTGQTSDKPRTTQETAYTKKVETSDKVRSQPRTLSKTKLGQTSDKPRTKIGFSSLVGLQRQVSLFIFDQTKIARDRITDPISISVLASSCESTVLSAQKTIQRLEEKGILCRAEYRNGRGGWTKYELPQEIFQEMLHLETSDKLRTYLGQSSDKPRTEPRTQLRTSASSSSSYVLEENLKTTTSDADLFENTPTQLAPEWQQLDISPLEPIGFTRTHLVQIIRQGKLSVGEVQDSINFYAFDLTRNGLKPNSQLNFFMGIVRKGIPYAPPDNYESPVDEARRKTREFKERQSAARQAEEQKLLHLEFQEWRRGLTSDDVLAIVPEFARRPGQVQESSLLSHFEKQIWPEISAKMAGLSIDRQQIQQEIEKSLAGEVG